MGSSLLIRKSFACRLLYLCIYAFIYWNSYVFRYNCLFSLSSFDLEFAMEIPVKQNQCPKCFKSVTARQQALSCDGCHRWLHRQCGTRMTRAEYAQISANIKNGVPFEWQCDQCELKSLDVGLPLLESTRIEESARMNSESR